MNRVVESGLRLEEDDRGRLSVVRRDGSPLTPGVYVSDALIAPAEPASTLPKQGEGYFDYPLPVNQAGFEFTVMYHWGETSGNGKTLKERFTAISAEEMGQLDKFMIQRRETPALTAGQYAKVAALEAEMFGGTVRTALVREPVTLADEQSRRLLAEYRGKVSVTTPSDLQVVKTSDTAIEVTEDGSNGVIVGGCTMSKDLYNRLSTFARTVEVFPTPAWPLVPEVREDDDCDAPTVVGG